MMQKVRHRVPQCESGVPVTVVRPIVVVMRVVGVAVVVVRARRP
jgi:hypothetical protein